MTLFLFLGAFNAGAASLNGSMKEAAREFAIQAQLLDLSLESDLAAIGVKTAWEATQVKNVRAQSGAINVPLAVQLVVLELVTRTNGKEDRNPNRSMEVIAIDQKTGNLELFEQAVELPKRIGAQIGDKSAAGQFFVVLAGKNQSGKSNVAQAAKAYLTGNSPGAALHGFVIHGGRLSFDTTPKRTWSMVDASYDLRNTDSPEGTNYFAYQFDATFEEDFNMASKVRTSTGELGADVIPQGQDSVLKLFSVK
jgi:hypothetical protein